MTSPKLPIEQAWSGAHASEAALVMVADAQVHLVPDAVVAHVEGCADCSRALAEAAMLSVRTGEELLGVPRGELVQERAKVVRLTIPWRALLAAAAVGLVGALPSLVEAPAEIGTAAATVVRSAPQIARGLSHVFEASGSSPWVTLAPAALLLLLGFALTRALPTPVSKRVEP
jgi:hypothetical protein